MRKQAQKPGYFLAADCPGTEGFSVPCVVQRQPFLASFCGCYAVTVTLAFLSCPA